MAKKRIQTRYVVGDRISWDAWFYNDILNGRGFIISEPAEINLDGKQERSLYGAQSPLFGSTPQDEHAYAERFRCTCGSFTGKQFLGEICPVCGDPIEARDADIKMCGWITLGTNENKLNVCINPLYYVKLQQALGKNIFNDIISAKYKVDRHGRRSKPKDEDMDSQPSSIYAYCGIDYFFDNYETILNYFKTIKKTKTRAINILLKEKRKVFVSHIPIFTTLLRPQSVTTDSFYYMSIDRQINTLFTLSEHIKNCNEIERDDILERIQKRVNAIWTVTFDSINKKNGLIRNQLLGGSLNYTARNVIIPNPELDDNECVVSYNTFLQMYKFKIIHYIMQIYDVRLDVADRRWKQASAVFDQDVYDIMEHILKVENVRVLINRNPTLNFYSMLLLKIKEIRKDANDFTLAIPLSILPGLNADFDGDILNLIGLVDESLVYMFRKFDPVFRMMTSRDTGLLNPYFAIEKSEMITLYSIWELGECEGDTPEMTEEEIAYEDAHPESIIDRQKVKSVWED